MTCKNLIAICSKTHLPCPHVSINGECKEAECANAVVPTWQELLDIYAAASKPTVRRMKSIIGNFRTMTKVLGTSLDAKVTVTDEQVEEIRPFIGNPDELVIPLDVSKRGNSGRGHGTHGEYVAHHASLRKYAIDFMKSIGVTDRKPQYALRKDCSQQTIRKHGILHEAQMLGHTPRVAMRNYADISKIELREGL